MLAAGSQALPWDLAFPEVFRRQCGAGQGGFDAVLSNPPWDIMQPNTAEFLAGFDLAILDAPSRQEAHAIRDRLLADPGVATAWRDYQAVFARQQRLVDRLYQHQRLAAHGTVMGGKLDLYRVFAERMVRLVEARAPSAWWFHRRSTPMRARRASVSSICERHGSSSACRSKTGTSCSIFTHDSNSLWSLRGDRVRRRRCDAAST